MLKYLFPLILLPTIAVAQQQQQQGPTPAEKALQDKLLIEINSSLQCMASNNAGQTELAKVQKELADLKAKYEPKEQK